VHYEPLPAIFETCVEALGCDIELVAKSVKYGAVKKAQLRLRGRTRRAVLRYCPEVVSQYERKFKLDAGLVEGNAYARGDALEPEFASHSSLAIQVLLLEVVRKVRTLNEKGRGDAISEGLILRQLPSHQYSRVGTFAFYTDAKPGQEIPQNIWFNKCDEEVLRLI
jgi:hypothetical protein